MTRATLLQVLARPAALGQAEVRELEQLAQAFPYCQTAHLLLAKAAHDQGTMLAGQRLRRAATYAADRALLRRLIEEVEPAPEPKLAEAPARPAPAPAPPETPASVETIETPLAVAVAEAPAAPTPALVQPVPAATPPVAAEAPEATLAPEPADAPATRTPEPSPQAAEPLAAAPDAEVVAPAPPVEALVEPEPITAIEVAPPAVAVDETVALPVLMDQEGVFIPAVSPAPELLPEPAVEAEPDLPAQAPAIRPPVEVGEARFEFGLAEPPPPPPTYELPGLVDEWAASAVTRSLGGPEPITSVLPLDTPAAPPALTPAAFTGDETIGYGFGESSRLGLSLQLLNLLTSRAEAGESAVAAPAPAAPLPPTGAFFEPDPLLLDHWATHRPPAPVLPSSLDLINNFLRRQPRLTRPGMLPPSPAVQADLSVRSTRAEPDLVSENLARIFVRQGKTARAIEIYEKLMVKQPEKMAYFAAQIQSLQPSA